MLDKNIKPSTGPQDPVFALGRQLTIEYYDCQDIVLLNRDTVEQTLLTAAKES